MGVDKTMGEWVKRILIPFDLCKALKSCSTTIDNFHQRFSLSASLSLPHSLFCSFACYFSVHWTDARRFSFRRYALTRLCRPTARVEEHQKWCMQTHRNLNRLFVRAALFVCSSWVCADAYVRWAHVCSDAQHNMFSHSVFLFFLLLFRTLLKCTAPCLMLDAFECIFFLMQNQSLLILWCDSRVQAPSPIWFMHASAASEINFAYIGDAPSAPCTLANVCANRIHSWQLSERVCARAHHRWNKSKESSAYFIPSVAGNIKCKKKTKKKKKKANNLPSGWISQNECASSTNITLYIYVADAAPYAVHLSHRPAIWPQQPSSQRIRVYACDTESPKITRHRKKT